MAAPATEQSSEKVAYWTGHIKGWQHSGLSQDAYCRRHDLPLSSLRYWRSRLAKQSASPLSTPVTIVPVPLATPSQAITVALEPILVHVGDDFILKQGATPVIPPKENRRVQREYDRHLYKERHLVECFFCKIKEFRRIAMRYEKLARTFLAMLTIASCLIWLR